MIGKEIRILAGKSQHWISGTHSAAQQARERYRSKDLRPLPDRRCGFQRGRLSHGMVGRRAFERQGRWDRRITWGEIRALVCGGHSLATPGEQTHQYGGGVDFAPRHPRSSARHSEARGPHGFRSGVALTCPGCPQSGCELLRADLRWADTLKPAYMNSFLFPSSNLKFISSAAVKQVENHSISSSC